MAYNKTVWTDRQVPKPLTFTYPLTDNGNGTTTLVPAEGIPTTAGTPITANFLNNLETQYDNAIADVNTTLSTVTTWKPTTWFNGWRDFNTFSYPSHITRDASGKCSFYMNIVGGSAGLNVVPFNIPSPYRPTSSRMLTAYFDGNPTTPVIMHINSAGEVKWLRGFTGDTSVNFLIAHTSYNGQ